MIAPVMLVYVFPNFLNAHTHTHTHTHTRRIAAHTSMKKANNIEKLFHDGILVHFVIDQIGW